MKTSIRLGLAIALCSGALCGQTADGIFATGAVAKVLDAFHQAASAADEEKYFSFFAPGAVFLGTDAGERWTLDEFRKYAHARFAKGTGWTYKSKARWITFSADYRVAWFDELLENAHYGTCRGSGVLVRVGDSWKIAQYNLAMLIPNDLADDVAKTIREFETRRHPQ